jgi:signal transduction histidine kinase/ActR/RegA family two-component response regulator
MNGNLIHEVTNMQSGLFPREWLNASLVLALICICVVIALSVHLYRFTGKRCYLLWTAAWLFFAVHMAASIGLVESPDTRILIVARPVSLAVCAFFMFWGSSLLTHWPLRFSRAWVGLIPVVVLICGAAYWWQDARWVSVAPMLLLGITFALTAVIYLRLRKHNRGAKILGVGFLVSAVQLVGFASAPATPAFLTVGSFASAILALMIGVGMIVEQELAVSELEFRALFDSAKEAMFIVDLWSLKVLAANLAAQHLTKRDESDLRGASILELCPDLRRDGENLVDHRKMFQAVFKPYSEFHFAQADRTLVACEGEATVVQWQRQTALQIRVQEVDRAKKTGQIMRRAEKLSSLGQLIAGVAHELNNPLAVVVGYAQILAKQQIADQKITASVQNILHESERAAKIVRDLLSFARPTEPQMSTVKINRLVSNVVDIRETELRSHNIRVEKRLAPELQRTKADASQIEQVLTNLVTNAIHALSGHTGPRKITVSTEERGFFIRISVADTGPGIPHEIQGRIFDPFFTTKTRGKGTGLGLTISNSIVQEHRGKLWVQSEPGKGATFFMELPIVPCEPEHAVEQPVAGGVAFDPDAGARRLLIVDDEPGIIDVLKEVLGSNGYTVETALNGAEAMQQLQTNRYDLIISDLCMPQMDGQKFYKTVQETSPELAKRVIFVTGDTVSPSSRAFLESTGNRWFSKPFNISEVEEVVGSLLQQQPVGARSGNGNGVN